MQNVFSFSSKLDNRVIDREKKVESQGRKCE